MRDQIVQAQVLLSRLTFDSLFPGERRVCKCMQAVGRGRRSVVALPDELQELQLQVEGGILSGGFYQALHDEAEWLLRALRLRVDARIERAEVPALAILDRRGAVWVEDVSLIKNGGGNLFHAGEVHASISVASSAASARAMVCSQVGMP